MNATADNPLIHCTSCNTQEHMAMTVVGNVESLWRYPVKSMRGEEIRQSYLGFSGVYGDRLYAFHDKSAPQEFPFLTGREQERMLLYQPRFRHAEDATLPPNVAEADSGEPGLTPVYSNADLALDIEIPSGEVLAIDDPNLITKLSEGLDGAHALALLRSERSFTDCRPVSVFSIQTVQQVGDEVGISLDKRRFRANVYADLTPMSGFAENSFVGHRIQIGPKAVIAVTDRDPRCKMITLDPNTAQASLEILRTVRDFHEGKAWPLWGSARRGDCLTRRRNQAAGLGEFSERTMRVTGGCHCGHIAYEAEVDPATVRVCHCTDCQKLTGTAFRTNIASLPGTFVLKSGTPKIYIKTAESGGKRAHAFCPECGTPIYAAAPEPKPSTYALRVGAIEQRIQFSPPIRQIWCRSALPWSMDLTGVERAERQ